ncbi:Protein kinase domain protein [Tolypocladium capitatum]|uniref:Protein kinase domain protein n=1 Tax=Tolypocladium capitatum TaxID=45235 RepID=A0A2K3QRA0_9HYPO|nr:Protein kinase domain protein [Tolypocladium capitatum]
MQFTLAMVLIALQGAGVLSVSIETQCGKLGVNDVDRSNLGPDVDPNNIRPCKEHPEAAAANPNSLTERACYLEKTVGCSIGGYCFKQCDPTVPGAWCWTAQNAGLGHWVTCTVDADCTVAQSCGVGTCDACGCSC